MSWIIDLILWLIYVVMLWYARKKWNKEAEANAKARG